jgi:hypothetical protein
MKILMVDLFEKLLFGKASEGAGGKTVHGAMLKAPENEQ